MNDLFAEIAELKQKKNAVILAHYYQDADIQDIADFIGDSLELSRRAASTNADIIVFAGVHFMAETAKILNPTKKVLVPDMKAGCSLADSCQPKPFLAFKQKHPNAVVVSYINCSAEIKAMSDYICTSSNAERVIHSIPKDREIIFAPDKNLGAFLAKKTGRPLILWQGSCIVHEIFSEKKLVQLKERNRDAEIIAHPECQQNILQHANFVGSTSALLKYSQESPTKKFIVVTESGILHQMRKAAPNKDFIPAPPESNCACNDCPYMKLNTLEKIYDCLKSEKPELEMSEALRVSALTPLKRMLSIS